MKKRFVISRGVYERLAPMFTNLMNTVNKQKIGKHRRGTLSIIGLECTFMPDGNIEVVVRMRRSSAWKRIGIYKFRARQFADYAKLFRLLSLA